MIETTCRWHRSLKERERLSQIQGGLSLRAKKMASEGNISLGRKELNVSPSGYAHLRQRLKDWPVELPYIQIQKPHDMELLADIRTTDSNDNERLEALAKRVTKGFYQFHRSGEDAIFSGVVKFVNGFGFWLPPFASSRIFVDTLKQNSIVVGQIETEKEDSRNHIIHFIFEKQRDRAEIALLEEKRLGVFRRKIS